MDVNLVLNTATEEHYFKMLKRKTASLFRDAAYCGALAGGGTASEALSLSKYGENIGIAYQLRDDLLDLQSSIEFLPRLNTRRISLPLIHLYEISDLKTREQLEEDFFGEEQNRSCTILKRIRRMLLESGSIAYCERKLDDYVQKSLDTMKSLKENEQKSYLIQMTDFLVL
jgi:geranylgeranyl pyrophosphate synthase